MLVFSSKNKTPNPNTTSTIHIDQTYLQNIVEAIAIPRHYEYERKNNQKVRQYIDEAFQSLGLNTIYQGEYRNIIATYQGVALDECQIIIGGHYDSVPHSSGADDNASAIAGILTIAKALKEHAPLPIAFIAFNREEDGLLGSYEFVHSLSAKMQKQLQAVHIFEMIGYHSDAPKSQSVPQGLPIKVNDVGDFIAIIANKTSNHLISSILQTGNNYLPNLKVKALKIFWGMERYFPHLERSDHSPFWEHKIPALMWTDTSEFRNPHYHQPSDTPDTLNYDFMHDVVKLVALHTLKLLQKETL